eukprot:4846367-Prymnesium_polylepis.1
MAVSADIAREKEKSEDANAIRALQRDPKKLAAAKKKQKARDAAFAEFEAATRAAHGVGEAASEEEEAQLVA